MFIYLSIGSQQYCYAFVVIVIFSQHVREYQWEGRCRKANKGFGSTPNAAPTAA